MKRASTTRRKLLKSKELQGAFVNVIKCLCQIGYISVAEMRELEHRVKAGDMTAYKEVRERLLEMADDLKKI